MALISAKTIITSVSLFHLTLAYFFLTNPSSLDGQALVYMLGESMGMVYALLYLAPGYTSNSRFLVALCQRLRDTKSPARFPRRRPHLYRLQRSRLPLHA